MKVVISQGALSSQLKRILRHFSNLFDPCTKYILLKKQKRTFLHLIGPATKNPLKSSRKCFLSFKTPQLRELDNQSNSNMAIQDTGLAESIKRPVNIPDIRRNGDDDCCFSQRSLFSQVKQ